MNEQVLEFFLELNMGRGLPRIVMIKQYGATHYHLFNLEAPATDEERAKFASISEQIQDPPPEDGERYWMGPFSRS